MRPSICACVLAFVAALGGSPVRAGEEIYRWIDAGGVIHYSEVAPRDADWERITPGARVANRRPASLDNPRAGETGDSEAPVTETPQPQNSGATDESPQLSEQQQAMQQRLEEQAAERLAELEQTRRENCSRAREQFQQFTTYARIRVQGEDGGTRVLEEEERQQRIAQAREAIVLNCDNEG